jgi:excisionase family DNA binding protein
MTRRASPGASQIGESSMGARPVTKLRTVAETAELLNTSTRTIHRLIQSHALPVHRFGRVVRISDADIAAFLAANRNV